MRLEKITLDYVAEEDRILVRGEDANGQIVAFWLTLRMSRVLCKQLLGHLDKLTAVPPATDRELMQTFRQTSALMKLEPGPAVKAGVAAPMLLTTLDLHKKPGGVLLRLPLRDGGGGGDGDGDGHGNGAALALDTVQLRQYLHLLRKMFVRADWPLDIWPDWMSEAASEAAGAQRSARPLH